MKRKLGLYAAFLLASVCALSTAACSGGGGKTAPAALPAPTNLQIADKTLTWGAVANAGGYTVAVNSDEHAAATTTYSLSSLAAGAYTLKVKAKGDGANYGDSPWSETKTYTAEAQTPDYSQYAGKYYLYASEQKQTEYWIQVNADAAWVNSYGESGTAEYLENDAIRIHIVVGVWSPDGTDIDGVISNGTITYTFDGYTYVYKMDGAGGAA
jgi:hypothetical protein